MPRSPSRHENRGRNRFAFGPLVGSGTFGEVYLARMTSPHGIEQDVAVKLLNADVDPRSQPVSRMRDEGRMLAGLNHPAILQVVDLCHLDGRIGLVTEYVPGADLDDCIHGVDPIPLRAALQVVGAVADALHAAWESRATDGSRLALVHRDIKPANIRVTPHGSVKLLDFGIAKSEDIQRETATQQRAAFGTPAYMAPEVLSYEVVEALPSRDVFALGCTLYEAIVRERWFEDLDHKTIGRVSNRAERFEAWRAERMARLEGVPAEVIALLDRMLAYDHTTRPTAREVAEQCIGVADGLQGPSLWNWARQRRWPPIADTAGPWTGRVLVDTGPVDERAPRRQLAPGGRVSAIETSGAFFDRLVEAERADRAAPLPMPLPRVARASVGAAPPSPAQTAFLATPLGLATVGMVTVAVGLVIVAAILVARPDLFFGAAVAEPSRSRAQGAALRAGADDEDTGEAEVREITGGLPVAWGADVAPLGNASVRLVGAHDVRLRQEGRAPLRLDSDRTVRVPVGPLEVEARFGGRTYQHQFQTVLTTRDALVIVCDEVRQKCQKRQ